jgi:NEDD4-binding protein 2
MKLYLIRGVSGSGKTTLARDLAFHEIAADYYFEERKWNNEFGWTKERDYEFDSTRLSMAHTWCKAVVGGWMFTNIESIAVHNTFTTWKEIEPYIDMANEFGYTVVSLVVENRHGSASIHDVPDETLKKQETRLLNSLKLR